MRILGIDPGYGIVGYSIIEYKGNIFKLLKADSIKTEPNLSLYQRLCQIYDELDNIIKKYSPTDAAIETLYFNHNSKTVMGVAEARGVILLKLKQLNINIKEYTPLQLKQAVTGYGRATKIQVQEMVKNILNLKVIPKLDDTTDAMAIAICHAHSKYSLLNNLV